MLLEEFDPCETAVFNPAMVCAPVKGMPEVAVSCFSSVTFERMVSGFPEAVEIARMKCASQEFPVYRVEVRGVPVALYQSGVGAPQCVGALEEAFAMGVRCVVLFGTCGVLDRNIEDCGIILPTSALRDEGTSYHYAPPSDEIRVNLRYREVLTGLLNEMHIRHTQGKCWTTDSMYRETREKVARRKAAGCVCVDMECASCAAAAQFRGRDVLQFFYAADNLDSDVWDERSLSNSARVEDKDRIAHIALETAARITEQIHADPTQRSIDMPYIATTANIAISGRKEQIIKERMGKAIELIPGKSESWLMLSFRDNVTMFFKGEDDPCAICEVKLYGSADEEAYAALTEALTDILREELDIDPDRIYVTYSEVDTWGWNGGNL